MAKRFGIAAVVIVLVLVLDQVSKYLVRTMIDLGARIPEDSFICLTYSRNKGVSFSMLQNAGILLPVLITVFVALLLIATGVYISRGGDLCSSLCLAGMSAGGIGNLIDRYIYGWVTDFISVGDFPIFNIADSALVCSCIVLLLRVILSHGNIVAALENDKQSEGDE